METHVFLSEVARQYQAVLERDGPAGLGFLNARVPHRYSAVYQLSAGVLRNLYLFDKLGEVTPQFLEAVPLQESFCQFVLRDGAFATADTAADRRLDGHKYQGVMGSYHGLPVLDNFGQLSATLCHFDSDLLPLADLEFLILRQAAKLLPRYLGRRPR
jgi:hypothetical protein